MKNSYILILGFLLFIGFGVFLAPSKADAYYGSYYQPYYDIPSYSTDYPGYHGYRNSYYPVDNNYITPKSYKSYQATYSKNTYNYNYNYNYNFYNAQVYRTSDVAYPYNNYNMNHNTNYGNYDYEYDNNESCYGYGC